MFENNSFFAINIQSINLISFVVGAFFASMLYRVKAMIFVALYFICLSIYFGVKLYPIH